MERSGEGGIGKKPAEGHGCNCETPKKIDQDCPEAEKGKEGLKQGGSERLKRSQFRRKTAPLRPELQTRRAAVVQKGGSTKKATNGEMKYGWMCWDNPSPALPKKK